MTKEKTTDQRWTAGSSHPAIVTVGNPLLRLPPAPMAFPSGGAPLFARMVDLLRELNGAGLAAPQIGESCSAVVIEVRRTNLFPDRPTSPLIQMANPRIESLSEDTEPAWEGCFSVPGLMGIVERPSSCKVAYQDPEGQERTEAFEGYVARVVQHEIDHLNGMVFLDRMETMASLTTVENYRLHHASMPLRGGTAGP